MQETCFGEFQKSGVCENKSYPCRFLTSYIYLGDYDVKVVFLTKIGILCNTLVVVQGNINPAKEKVYEENKFLLCSENMSSKDNLCHALRISDNKSCAGESS